MLLPGAPCQEKDLSIDRVSPCQEFPEFAWRLLLPGRPGLRSRCIYPLYINIYHIKKQKTANFTGINIISQSISTVLSHSTSSHQIQQQRLSTGNPKIYFPVLRHSLSKRALRSSRGRPGYRSNYTNPHYLSLIHSGSLGVCLIRREYTLKLFRKTV